MGKFFPRLCDEEALWGPGKQAQKTLMCVKLPGKAETSITALFLLRFLRYVNSEASLMFIWIQAIVSDTELHT